MKILNEFIEREMLKGISDDTLRRKNIVEYIRITGKDLAPKLVNRKLTYLRQFFDYLLTEGEILLNPVLEIERLKEEDDKPSGVFTELEIKDILEASLISFPGCRRKSITLMTRDRAILELLYSTGLRSKELVSLDADDVDLQSREISVRKGKYEKERVIPAGDEALKALMEYLEAREKLIKPGKEYEALFISRQGNRLSSVSVRKMIQRRKREAGVKSKGITHAFRHSFASHMLKGGAPIEAIKRILGHEHIETTERYAHVADFDLRKIHRETHPGSWR